MAPKESKLIQRGARIKWAALSPEEQTQLKALGYRNDFHDPERDLRPGNVDQMLEHRESDIERYLDDLRIKRQEAKFLRKVLKRAVISVISGKGAPTKAGTLDLIKAWEDNGKPWPLDGAAIDKIAEDRRPDEFRRAKGSPKRLKKLRNKIAARIRYHAGRGASS